MKRITPDYITDLKDNEVFVFGSNEAGRHGKGAAKDALKWGAKYGHPNGIQGRTYAIPTVNASISSRLSLAKIKFYVDEFITFAMTYPEVNFMVTPVGCGLAGWEVKDIAPLFRDAAGIKNIYLPRVFWDILGEE